MNDMPRIAGADPATCARDAAGTAIAHGHRAGIRSQPAHLRAMFGLAVAACCWLGACGLPGDIAYTSVRGTVTTDGGTPIEGATVLVRWSHTSPGGGHIGNTEYCARLATATTDALGRFEVATPLDEIWAAGLADNPPAVTIWANGYDVAVLADGYPAISTQLTPKPTSGQPFNSHNRPRIGAVTVAVPMTPVQRDSHDTFMALVEQFDQADQCKSYGSRDAVRAHFERIAEQAAAIAKTRYETPSDDSTTNALRVSRIPLTSRIGTTSPGTSVGRNSWRRQPPAMPPRCACSSPTAPIPIAVRCRPSGSPSIAARRTGGSATPRRDASKRPMRC